jgi:cyclohexa-1,5-dienecarbonyl-CoA hydratase
MTRAWRYCRLESRPPVARLTLVNPPLNIWSLPMLEEMHGALDEAEAHSEVSIFSLAAEGERAFSAGVEARDHLPDRLDEMIDRFHGLCRRILELEAVTTAAVHGLALGGAMELLACCDFVLADEEAIFGHPEIDLACFPPLGAALYPTMFGPKRAAEIVLLGEKLTAAEAKDLGLVTRVVPASELGRALDELESRLSQKSSAALRVAKRALLRANERRLLALPEIETLYREELAATDDMLEGLQAFLAKRKPHWKGR